MQVDLRHKVNQAYHSFMWNEARWAVLYGGAGSGKSYAAAEKHVIRSMAEPGHRFVLTRKVGRTLRQSVWALARAVISDWGVSDYWSENKTDMTLRFEPNGSEMVCCGLDDVEKLKSIHGITGFWHEEATELSLSDIIQANLRLRGETPSYKQNVLTFNPISMMHWLKQRFFDQETPNTWILRTTARDNQFIDDEYLSELEELKHLDPIAYQVYALGMWGEFKGLVYVGPKILTVPEWPDINSFDEVIYGLDFGFNNPMAMVRVGYRDGEAFEEEVLYERGLTTGGLLQRMPNLVKCQATRLRSEVPIYCDSAEPDRIQELRDAGWNAVPASKVRNSVIDGIDFCKRLRPYVHEESGNLLKEYGSYCWKVDKNDVLHDEPVKFNDHLMDARRYAHHTHWKETQFAIGALTTVSRNLLP